jgi:hypothetical protein
MSARHVLAWMLTLTFHAGIFIALSIPVIATKGTSPHVIRTVAQDSDEGILVRLLDAVIQPSPSLPTAKSKALAVSPSSVLREAFEPSKHGIQTPAVVAAPEISATAILANIPLVTRKMEAERLSDPPQDDVMHRMTSPTMRASLGPTDHLHVPVSVSPSLKDRLVSSTQLVKCNQISTKLNFMDPLRPASRNDVLSYKYTGIGPDVPKECDGFMR